MHEWTYNNALGCYEVTAPMQCDGDGANGQTGGIACYAPRGMASLDYLANAGHPGDWWGILTDKHGTPIMQDHTQPAPGAYISTTSYQFERYPNGNPMPINDVNRYLDAARIPFVVVPDRFRKGVPGVVLGCYCEVSVGHTTLTGIVGDIGPDFGEASIAMCRLLDPEATPKNGPEFTATYSIWPGRPVPGYPLLRRPS